MCWTEGHMSKGNDVVLKCFANGGSQPLSYKWAKISGHTHPYRAGSYHSQHSFHSELSYQESFHSSINQGQGNWRGQTRDKWEDQNLWDPLELLRAVIAMWLHLESLWETPPWGLAQTKRRRKRGVSQKQKS